MAFSKKIYPEDLILYGINCHSAPVTIAQNFFKEDSELQRLADEVRNIYSDASVFVISTCDRTDLVIYQLNEDAYQHIKQAIFYSDADFQNPSYFYEYRGILALQQLLRIACALDSRVIGETQILGQMKHQIEIFNHAHLISPLLKDILDFIYHWSAKIRHESGLGSGIVSLTNSALTITKDIFGDLRSLKGLIIGLGERAEVIANRLEQSGTPRFDLSGPARRTERIAKLRERRFIESTLLINQLFNYDIIITAHGTGDVLLTISDIKITLKKRNQRAVLLIDGSNPGDLDPAIDKLNEAYFYPYEMLVAKAEKALQGRHQIAKHAENLVDLALIEQQNLINDPDLIDLIVKLRHHFERTREDLLTQRPGLNSHELSQLLINRLLHHPLNSLQQTAQSGDLKQLQQLKIALAHIFPIS